MSRNFIYVYILYLVFIYLLASLDLHCGPQAFCSYSGWGLLFVMGSRFFLLQSTGYRMCRLQLCTGTGAQAQLFQCTGLAAPRHVGSSQTTDWTGVLHFWLFIARQTSSHWLTRRVLSWNFNMCMTWATKWLETERSSSLGRDIQEFSKLRKDRFMNFAGPNRIRKNIWKMWNVLSLLSCFQYTALLWMPS